jgi:hypothetical protein
MSNGQLWKMLKRINPAMAKDIKQMMVIKTIPGFELARALNLAIKINHEIIAVKELLLLIEDLSLRSQP